MKFNYKLKRVCGAYYGYTTTSPTAVTQQNGSNLLYDATGNVLISAVSNRVQVIDLKTLTVRTLPVEARSNIRFLALSPPSHSAYNSSGRQSSPTLLCIVDVGNHVMLVNFQRGIVLHRMYCKKTVRHVSFSPDGQYLALGTGKHVQVWCTPQLGVKEFVPLILHRTYTGPALDITSVEWSTDSSVLAGASRDGTVRFWTVHTTKNYTTPITLSGGHKRPIVNVHLVVDKNESSGSRIAQCYSISEDGALVTWQCQKPRRPMDSASFPNDDGSFGGGDDDRNRDNTLGNEAVNFFTGGLGETDNHKRPSDAVSPLSQAQQLVVYSSWSVKGRHYLSQDGGRGAGGAAAKVTVTSYCPSSQLLAVGFSSGIFGLYEMPSVANIHTLSVGAGQLIKSCVLNETGDWLALGCPASQQLFVWEWRSETYILKQRGHAYGMMRCMAYSPDGVVVCTGGEDGKIKLWNATSGFCYVTMEKSHTAPITAVAFAKPSVVLSASLDGTVQAHDLYRYRTFRTLTTPTPVQFLSLAVDPSGEIVTAGTTDPFHIYVWNLQTGKILDVLTGHAGPVCDLTFQTGGTLASGSWDGTVKLWDIYKGNVPSESLHHTSDVVCVSSRPDGREICTGTIGGLLSFWDVESAKLKFEIDGRRDIAGGRKMNDRMTADNNAASRYFTSVCYSADGSCVLAGGNSKYVCIYEVSQQILLKKFQVTFNRSLDGILDELNSKNLRDGGPVNEEADSADEATYGATNLPGAKRNDDGSRSSKVEVLTSQVSFSSTGREWATISGEGLHVYSLDEDMIFDPIALTEEITPACIESKLATGDHGTALRMAIHLNEFALVQQVVEATPYDSIPLVVQSIRCENSQLERLVQFVAKVTEESPHIEFFLEWCLQILKVHGAYMDRHRSTFLRAFRMMHKAIQSRRDDLVTVCNENRYTLQALQDQAKLALTNK